RAVSLGRDHELLHDIPQEYVVDQQRGISDPVGMTGTRLEVEMYLVTVQSTAAQNLRRSVERARYRPAELVLEPLAASYAVLTDDEKELGVALGEVGGERGAAAGGRGGRGGAAGLGGGGVRGRTGAGRGGAEGRDGAAAGDGGAGARGVRGSGAGRDAGAGDLGARRQRAGAALCSTGGPGVVRGAATRAGRRSQRLVGQECGRRAVVRTAEAVVAGLLLIGHPREP